MWATKKSTSDSSTSDVIGPRAIGTLRRFFTDTRTIATGAVLTVFGVLYVVRRKYISQHTTSRQ